MKKDRASKPSQVRLRSTGYRPGSTMKDNLNIRIESDLMELIRQAASIDERPVSQWVRLVLKRAAEEQLSEKRGKEGGDVGS